MPNPFEQDVIYDPRRLRETVNELNGAVLERVIGEFEAIATDPPLPRWEPRKAILITSAQAGYGKSHLIGRLFAELAGHANLIYISPFIDASSAWRSLLSRIMQELKLPERIGVEFANIEEPSQLEQLSHGIFVNLTIQLLKAGVIKSSSNERAIERLKGEPLKKLRENEKYLEWIRAQFKNYAELLARSVRLRASVISWLKVLFLCAYYSEDFALREACFDWMGGGSIDEGTARDIGLLLRDIPPVENTRDEINRLCQERFMDFCQLAKWYRPFIFCFDQTENYGNQEALARELGTTIERIVTEASHHLTIITANRAPWLSRIIPNWEDAHQHRVREALELQGLNRAMAVELINKRLEPWDVTEQQKHRMLDDGWLDSIYNQTPEIGIRQFLQLCRARWDDTPLVKPTLEDLFKKYFHEVQSKPDRRRFNRDALLWFVKEVMGRGTLTDVTMAGRGAHYYELRGRVADRTYLVGFEEGTHWARWKAIIETARTHYQKDSRTCGIMLRTADQPVVPRPTWQQVIRLLREGQGRYFRIVMLDADETIAINALHDLYNDAISGDVEYTQQEVLAFATRKLAPVFTHVLRTSGPPEAPVEPPAEQNPTPDLIARVREFVREQRLTTFDALVRHCGDGFSEDEIANARGCIAEIEVYSTPSAIVLLWRP